MVDTVKKPAPKPTAVALKAEPPKVEAPKVDSRVDKLEAEIAAIKAVMRRNGWSLPKD